MCGLFGISAKKNNNLENSTLLENDLKVLTKRSQQRGSDTFGVVIKDQHENSIFKINQDPSEALKRSDFKEFLNKKLNDRKSEYISIIGQTRLVTNGSKFSEINNQPLVTKNIIGVHNGIFTNLEINESNSKTKNYESISIKSDSLKFYEQLSDLVVENEFIKNYLDLLQKVRGNYSIAFALKDYEDIYLSSNCGSLYYYYDENVNFFCFASEKNILLNYLKDSEFFNKNKFSFNNSLIKKCFKQTIIFNPKKNEISIIESEKYNKNSTDYSKSLENKFNSLIFTNYEDDLLRHSRLKRCSKCILLETYPFISFDKNGVCNFCLRYNQQKFIGDEDLVKMLDKHRSKSNEPDCIVGLSGGRDSSYGLHLIKKKYNMNPIAYTWDWGLTTDISRINAAKLCGKLGVEHIIRAAKIDERRSHVRTNLFAWLKKPHLGMIPMLQSGDKGFYEYGRKLSKELNLKLVIHCTGYQLEQREFFLGFLGVNEILTNNPTLSDYSLFNKINMFFRYGMQYFLNPSYFNTSFFASLQAFIHSFVYKERFLHLFKYIKWDENKIIKTLNEEYEWESDVSYGKNQWRMGDGQTAFNNYVYYTVAGFSEYDNFRANQVREGLITREEAMELSRQDNKIKYDTLKIYSEVIGFNLDSVLSKVNCIPKLY